MWRNIMHFLDNEELGCHEDWNLYASNVSQRHFNVTAAKSCQACLVGRSELQGKHSRRVKRSAAQIECIHYTKMIQNAFHFFCTVPESGLAADMGPSATTWFIWYNYDAIRLKEVTHTQAHTHIHTVQSRCYFCISHWIHTVQEDESDLLCLVLTMQSCNILC